MKVLMYVHPHPTKAGGRGRKRYYSYSFTTLDGRPIADNVADVYDMARALSLRGVEDWVEVIDAKTGKSRMTVQVAAAKGYYVADGGKDFCLKKWKPHPLGGDYDA